MGDDRRKRWRGDAPPPPSSPTMINPYHLLQVRQDATPAEIRGAYRRLALWHHPGRRKTGDLSAGDVQRQYDVFAMLAASYETLINKGSRQMYDALLRQDFDGEVWVGGRPWSPRLSPTFSSDSENVECDIPAALQSTTADSVGNDESRDALSSFVKARRGRSLSDPYDVFESVFGSRPFERQKPCSVPAAVVTAASRPTSAWTASTRILQNGSVVSTTSRVLHDRKLTRTEIITEFPDGRKRTVINVTGEDIAEQEAERQISTGCFVGQWSEAMNDCFKGFNYCGGMFPGIKGR